MSKSHGESRRTKEYRAWAGMKNRCFNRNAPNFKFYGGRGITICDAWITCFATFLSDMGRAPSPKHSLDRIDPNGNYEPNNCNWATPTEQSNNTRRNVHIEYKGERKTLAEWCTQLGLNYKVIYNRLFNYGFDVERAFSDKDHRGNNGNYQNFKGSFWYNRHLNKG